MLQTVLIIWLKVTTTELIVVDIYLFSNIKNGVTIKDSGLSPVVKLNVVGEVITTRFNRILLNYEDISDKNELFSYSLYYELNILNLYYILKIKVVYLKISIFRVLYKYFKKSIKILKKKGGGSNLKI